MATKETKGTSVVREDSVINSTIISEFDKTNLAPKSAKRVLSKFQSVEVSYRNIKTGMIKVENTKFDIVAEFVNLQNNGISIKDIKTEIKAWGDSLPYQPATLTKWLTIQDNGSKLFGSRLTTNGKRVSTPKGRSKYISTLENPKVTLSMLELLTTTFVNALIDWDNAPDRKNEDRKGTSIYSAIRNKGSYNAFKAFIDKIAKELGFFVDGDDTPDEKETPETEKTETSDTETSDTETSLSNDDVLAIQAHHVSGYKLLKSMIEAGKDTDGQMEKWVKSFPEEASNRIIKCKVPPKGQWI